MGELVSASHVFLDVEASSVDEVLRFLSEQAVACGVAPDAEALLAALREREGMGTTGMAGGFAIPHAKIAGLSEASVLVARLSEGVAWKSMDGVPVTCVIALLIPAEGDGSSLELLSRLAVRLMDEGFRAEVMAAEGADRIAAVISEGIA